METEKSDTSMGFFVVHLSLANTQSLVTKLLRRQGYSDPELPVLRMAKVVWSREQFKYSQFRNLSLDQRAEIKSSIFLDHWRVERQTHHAAADPKFPGHPTRWKIHYETNILFFEELANRTIISVSVTSDTKALAVREIESLLAQLNSAY